MPILLSICLLVLGCSRPLASQDDDDDSQDLPDLAADLPSEPTEFAGILVGLNYGVEPTRFKECESGEIFEITITGWDDVLKGSCDGVYNRVRGQLDRSFDPPRLVLEETLEARWCEPTDCVAICNPQYESCYAELQDGLQYGCSPPLDSCGSNSRCNPVRFAATQSAGWMHDTCTLLLGDGVAGDACEFPADAEGVDTCADTYRCWNPEGDITAPGTCVPYCDVTGESGPACDGTCVKCSSSAEWGLCMSGCSGEACNVEAFC